MLEYIQMYATSMENPDKSDKTSKKARELYKYLNNNKEGLLPYQKRGIEIPRAPRGIKYKNMGGAGKSKLYHHYPANEAQENEMVC